MRKREREREKERAREREFHADTAAIYSHINKTLNLQYHGIFCIIWHHIKVFAKCFHGK